MNNENSNSTTTNIHCGVNGVSQKVVDAWVGVDNVARKIIHAWVGVNGVAKQIF